MRVVVTGAAGFIGSHTVAALLDAGHDAVGLDAFRPWYSVVEKRRNAAWLQGRLGVRLVAADLLEVPLEPVLRGADAVVHLAAQPGVPGSWGDGFSSYMHDNIAATQRLLEAIVSAAVPRLVFASSSSVYGDAPSYPCSEDAALAPVSPYGVTKLAAEHLCLTYARSVAPWLRVTALRLFTVYGPRQRPDMALRRFLEAALDRRAVTVCGDGLQSRDFTYVGDVAGAIVRSVEREEPGSAVLNIGGGCRVSVNRVLDIIADLAGAPLVVHRGSPRPGDARHTGADCTRAATLIGYRPTTDLTTGLAAELAWLRSDRVADCDSPAAVRRADSPVS